MPNGVSFASKVVLHVYVILLSFQIAQASKVKVQKAMELRAPIKAEPAQKGAKVKVATVPKVLLHLGQYEENL